MKRLAAAGWVCLAFISSCLVARAQQASIRPTAAAKVASEREEDGLNGPVRRVRVETAKVILKDGKSIEAARVVSEVSTYDINGRKIDTVAYPVENSAPSGREQYRYDDKGNIAEMVVRGVDGSILSKEIYTYEFDELGNWKKMNASVAVYEDGKLSYEPVEVTYRTITYYYGQAIDKVAANAASKSSSISASTGNSVSPGSAASGQKVSNTLASKDVSDGTTVAPLVIGTTGVTNKSAPTSEASSVRKEVTTASTNANETPKAPSLTPAGTTSESSAPNKEVPSDPSSSKETLRVLSVGAPAQVGSVASTKVTYTSEDAPRTSNVVPAQPAAGSAKENGSPTAMTGGATIASAKTSTSATAAAKPVELSAMDAESGSQNYKQGLTYLRTGRYTEALDAFRQEVARSPEDALAFMKLGLAYSATLQYKEAVSAMKQAIRIKPQVVDAEAYYRLGEAYTALGKNSEAVNAFKQAMYITRNQAIEPDPLKYNGFPSADEAHYGLGLAYFNQGYYKDALKEFQQSVALRPGFDEAHYGIALANIGLNDLKSAEKEEKILRSLNRSLADKVAATLNRSVVLPPGISRGGNTQRQ